MQPDASSYLIFSTRASPNDRSKAIAQDCALLDDGFSFQIAIACEGDRPPCRIRWLFPVLGTIGNRF
jgi:hypothetical protein